MQVRKSSIAKWLLHEAKPSHRYFSSQGCSINREGGNHTVFVNTVTGKKVSVPRHPEVNDDLVKEICRQLGIPYPGKN